MQRTASLAPPSALPWARAGAALSAWRERLADPRQRPALLWHAFWGPFWIWSDIPAPPLPHRETAPAAEMGLAGQAVASGIDRVRRRLWVSHAAAALCRGIGLGLCFAALLMLLDVAGGPGFDPRPAIAIGALFLIAGLVLAVLSRPSRTVTARMLDRTFGLHERLTTALDDLGLGVPTAGERAPVVYLQMADAANAIAVLRNDRRLRPVLPVREIVLIVLVALLLTTLAFVRGLGGGLPQLSEAHVPPFTPAIERPVDAQPSQADVAAAAAAPPTVQEVQQRADHSSQARRDLQTLAAALADHAVTRPAAEQIARGDYAAAGDQLRESANQAGDLSQNARGALSSDLQRASEAMQPETNGLQEATRDAAAGLQQGDESARNEMRDLANAVENTGAQVVPQGELASQMRSAQQAQAQGGGADRAPSAEGGDASASSSQSSPSDDPGSGVAADSSVNSSAMQQRGDQGAPSNGEQSQGQEGQPGGGQPGQAGAPGAGEQGSEGAGRSPGDAAQTGAGAAAMEGADSAVAQRGGGAGTGESAQMPGNESVATGGSQSDTAGEQAADPNVSNGTGAEGDPGALANGQERIALPAGSGDQGVQTSANGGSALRGSGAGVTAGSGYAVQGDVGEAGPDSNRVPPRHRDTVERYFSEGAGQ